MSDRTHAVCNLCGGKGCKHCHKGWECDGEGCKKCVIFGIIDIQSCQTDKSLIDSHLLSQRKLNED